MPDQSSFPSVSSPVEVSVESGKTCWWCACGRSKTQPFCDGSHKGTSFTPLKYQATERARRWFCVCKQTGNRPFCDGANLTCAGIHEAAM
jgi:CDGSH iron-sulfur domain-containing protein 3